VKKPEAHISPAAARRQLRDLEYLYNKTNLSDRDYDRLRQEIVDKLSMK
jgi:hypothetical protein